MGPIVPTGNTWDYTLYPQETGRHTLRIESRDPKGNASVHSPFQVIVVTHYIYLPFVLRNH